MEKERVFVGLSGGVDSAVTAALLKKTGRDVTGVFIKGWYPPGMPCTWAEDRRDAMRVAAHLQIPFVTLDASKEYKESVIDYLIREYRDGRTPNPDIMCNRDVKFGAFHAFAKKNGARIATGHYAKTENGRLFRGADEGKDQSYFLWSVSKDALKDALFPLGDLHKEEVRRLAKRYGLPNALKKDSQGICFLGSISVEDFLRSEMHPEEGKVYSEESEEIGRHDGALLYTLGERIAVKDAPPGPWYVVNKDLETNIVTVSHGRPKPVAHETVPLSHENWFGEASGELEAQYRYHGPRVRGTYANGSFIPRESLPEPLASGQSLVMYRGEECLGGGIIT